MEISTVLATLARMFPGVNLRDAVAKAQQAIAGTPDNLAGVSAAAGNFGLNADIVNKIYSRYGQSAQARTVCAILGTTPEALKADTDRIIGGVGAAVPVRGSAPPASTAAEKKKFPRLK